MKLYTLLLFFVVFLGPGNIVGQATETLSVKSTLIQIPCIVSDRVTNRPIDNLSKDDFRVSMDGIEQRIQFLRHDQGTPLSIVLLLDVSLSQAGNFDRFIADLDTTLRPALHDDDDVAVITFARHIRLRKPLEPYSGYRPLALSPEHSSKELLPTPIIGGGTRVWDAIRAAESLLQDSGKRNVIILLSDGFDNASNLSWHQVAESTNEKEIQIIGVQYKPKLTMQLFGGGLIALADKRFENVVKASGGILLQSQNMPNLADALSAIRFEYILEFHISPAPSAGVHTLATAVNIDARVHAKDSFYVNP